ncbi:CcdC family protein [Paenibacillus protaetiae]|uniref:Cytochrome c biogenesis protein CcdC n=1 Tax=Paenibacillus protaetiae TaxID=2509456 RepID=A0A4P6EZM8_9BACL|nr:cytochrome c biogenesis protein CcdC [Paenibacillus protaetiae]QAY68564.1 cytochrome c biogenesis protein CcdC [Paenibacillus protaetiae]
MMHLSDGVMQVISIVVSLLLGSAIIFLRMKGTKRPTTLRKIIIPPLGMSTGALMFISPLTRVPWLWALITFALGLFVFSVPLILTTRLERVGPEIYVRRSKIFAFIIIGLLILRLALHGVVEEYMTIAQTAGLFFLLAFGMIIAWRISMLFGYMKLQKQEPAKA